MSLPLPIAEWRALLSEGPAVVMMAKADALALLDEIARLRADVEALRALLGDDGARGLGDRGA